LWTWEDAVTLERLEEVSLKFDGFKSVPHHRLVYGDNLKKKGSRV
jgi:hypothetical protein